MPHLSKRTWMLPATGALGLLLVALVVPRGNPPPPDAQIWLGRAAALLSLWSMFLSSLSSADPALTARLFGRSYRSVHHAYTVTGLLCMAGHPLVVALRLGTAAVFVPEVRSWEAFLQSGGRLAWYLFWLVAGLALFRRRPRLRRITHLLTYPALGLGVVHALMIGRTHSLLPLRVATLGMAAVVMAVPVWRRLRPRRAAARRA